MGICGAKQKREFRPGEKHILQAEQEEREEQERIKKEAEGALGKADSAVDGVAKPDIVQAGPSQTDQPQRDPAAASFVDPESKTKLEDYKSRPDEPKGKIDEAKMKRQLSKQKTVDKPQIIPDAETGRPKLEIVKKTTLDKSVNQSATANSKPVEPDPSKKKETTSPKVEVRKENPKKEEPKPVEKVIEKANESPNKIKSESTDNMLIKKQMSESLLEKDQTITPSPSPSPEKHKATKVGDIEPTLKISEIEAAEDKSKNISAPDIIAEQAQELLQKQDHLKFGRPIGYTMGQHLSNFVINEQTEPEASNMNIGKLSRRGNQPSSMGLDTFNVQWSVARTDKNIDMLKEDLRDRNAIIAKPSFTSALLGRGADTRDDNDAEGRKYRELWDMVKADHSDHRESQPVESGGWLVIEAEGEAHKVSTRDN